MRGQFRPFRHDIIFAIIRREEVVQDACFWHLCDQGAVRGEPRRTRGRPPVRTRLVANLGERGYLVLFNLVAWIGFGRFLDQHAMHRFDGAPGLGLGKQGGANLALRALGVLGVVLTTAALRRRGTGKAQR